MPKDTLESRVDELSEMADNVNSMPMLQKASALPSLIRHVLLILRDMAKQLDDSKSYIDEN